MPPDTFTIALIEDDPIMGEALQQGLELEGFSVEWWRAGSQALSLLARHDPDLVVCDIRLPDMDGGEVFARAARVCPAPFLFMTAFADIDQAVRLMRAGGGDYLTKPFSMDDFFGRARALIARRSTESTGTLGVSPLMNRIELLLRRIAPLQSPVLLTGETGVGKEVAVRFLHEISPTAEAPFIAVNCAAIPAELIESELFGHERGAFTGANARHPGYAERAKNGVLFLDEIGDLPRPAQAKLLRLLEGHPYSRVGGETPIRFAGRVICATNRDLESEVATGGFREDLYYRINTIPVEIPPLRLRSEDISWLLEQFFDRFSETMNPALRGVSVLAEEAALQHAWPGNIRELRNRMERAVALASGTWILPYDLFPDHPSGSASDASLPTLGEVRHAAEKRHISRILALTKGEIGEAARALGISRTTLWDKMRRLGLGKPEGRVP